MPIQFALLELLWKWNLQFLQLCRLLNSCAFNDTTCVALCACRSDYAGSGCELTNLEFEGLSKLRGQACRALGNLSASSAKSDTLVSFQEIFQPQNVNSKSASVSVSVLSQTLLPGLTLGGSVNDNEVAKVVTSIISSVGESNYYASLQGSGDPPENGAIKSLLNSFTTSLQMNMSAGQTHNLSAGVLAISVVARSISDIQNAILVPSASSKSYLNLSSANLMECALRNEEAAKFVLLEWSLSPYPGSSGLTTNLLGTSLAQSLTSSAVTSNASPSG